MRLRRTNGLDASYQHWTLATEKLTWTSDCRLHQGPSMRTNGFCVTKMFPWTLVSSFFILWRLRGSVLELVNGNCTNLNFKNLMCIAINFYVKSVGPPGSMDWTPPWHSILHQWNQGVVEQMQLNGFELWSNRRMLDYWKFVQYVAVLDDSRWLKRALIWNAGGGSQGRSFDLWDAPATKFCRYQTIGWWQVAGQDKALWLQYLRDYVTFMHL